MSQYVQALVAERPFHLYYQRAGTDADMATGNNAMSVLLPEPPQHDQTNWPYHYSDPSSTQPLPAFASYVGTSVSAPSSSYASSWQQNQNATQSAVTAVGSSVASPTFSIRVYPPSGSYEAFSEPRPLPDYPTSSQRTILQPSHSPPPPPPPPRNFLPLYGFRNDRHRSPSSHTSGSDFGWETPAPAVDEHQHLPTNMDMVDDNQSAGQRTGSVNRHHSVAASATTTTSHTSVKIEPNDPDGCFIMELPPPGSCEGAFGLSTPSAQAYTLSLLSQSLAPPTEVPLRATQANKEMKKMMGVFRLNPFAMHSLSVKLEDSEDGLAWDEDSLPPWCGGRPLDEEPLMFEFQLDLNSTDGGEEDEEDAGKQAEGSRGKGLETLESSDLRSFSPSFELHRGDIDIDNRDQERLMHDASHLEQDEDEDDQDQDQDHDQRSESWGEFDGSSHSEVGTTSTTTTRSAHTPFNDSPEGNQQAINGYGQRSQHTSSPTVWDSVGAHYQVPEEGHLMASPVEPKMNVEFGYANVRGRRLHTTTSHPYLRKSLQNNQIAHSHAHNLSVLHPSPDVSLPPQATHHSQGQVHFHPSNQLEYINGDTVRCDPLNFSYNEQDQNQHRVYAHISPNGCMMDMQQVDGHLPLSYMRLIRGPRHQELDQSHSMIGYPPRNTSSTSKAVGWYTSSSETTSHQGNFGLLAGGVTRRWSLPETGVMHGGPFLSSM